ncbi:MAG: hypothetical protein ABSH41_17490 [Syntrophobacteraceae bacterium]
MEKMQKPIVWCAVFVLWVLGAFPLAENMELSKVAVRSAWLLH